MRRRFVVLIDAAGPRLVRLNYYNQMCERCPRTQTDKWNMLANAQIVSTTQFVEIRREWMQGCEKETSNASNNYNENRSFLDVFFAETSWNHAGESIVPLPNTAKVGQRTKELSDHSDFGVVQTESNS